jgi:hypothetical protein
MTFTPVLKGDITTFARPIEQTTFLKRGFKKIAGIYRAPLARESSLEMCNWITKTADPVKATRDNCEQACRELAISEDDEVYQKQIQQALYAQTGGAVLLTYPSQEELIREHYKNF